MNTTPHISADSLESVAAIVYHGRSGTMFFQSLLDYHPQILMMPGTFVMTYHNWWDERECANLSIDQVIDRFVTDFEVLFNVNALTCPQNNNNPGIWANFHTMGESRKEVLEADKDVFLRVVAENIPYGKTFNRKLFFQAVHLAYAVAIGQDIKTSSQAPWIVFHLHAADPGRAHKIVEDFPSAVFFHTVREPVQSLGSRLKQVMSPFNTDGGSTVEELVHRIQAHYMGGGAILPQCYPNSYAIKLEDLKSNTQGTLLKVCQTLGIDWNDSLLDSTFGGLTWWNVSGAAQSGAFDKKSINKRHEDLFTEFDRLRLRILAQELNQAWNYDHEIWESDVEYIEMLGHPFKFERTLFADDAGRNQRNQQIAECIAHLWVNIRNYKGPQRPVQLLSTDTIS